MIYKDSRYSRSKITPVSTQDGKKKLYLHPARNFPNSSGYIHTAQKGEELDSVAKKYGYSETEWHIIADATGLLFPNLNIGDNIVVP